MMGIYHQGSTRSSPAERALANCSAILTAARQGQRTLHAEQATLPRLQCAGRCVVSGVGVSVISLEPFLHI